MILDYKLEWEDHYNYITGRATKLMNVLKVLRATWWGGHPQVLLNVYKALIRSTMEYNSFLTSCNKPNYHGRLQKIQNQCLRLAAGYRKSTPLNVVHLETNTI